MRPTPTRRSILGFAVSMMACPLCAIPIAKAEEGAPHWGYEGETGPARWSELSADFKSCSLGLEQTPIDLRDAVKSQAGSIEISYQAMPLTILNNGHTIQVITPPASKITIDGTPYRLLQYHFHHPSEHLLAGKGFDMELHFVHKSASGALTVVGVFIKPGASNGALAPIWSVMPSHESSSVTIESMSVNPAKLLPADREYFRYMGSLTTPPCSEGLTWTVFRSPIEASPEQIRNFAALFPLNARPVQQLNRRVLLAS
jgi:carbonic anhydrase